MSLAILDLIPKVGKISASDIRERLQTLGIVRDLRSVQRQMEMLCREFDIEQDARSRPYGYRWKPGAKGITIPVLGLQESLLLSLAEKHLRNLLPASLLRAMDGYFEQARYNLGTRGDTRLQRRWLDKVAFVDASIPLLPPEIRNGVLESVSQAMYHEHWLDVDYTNADAERRQRRVMPLGLAQQGKRLILVVRFEGYTQERSLALNRIQQATDTGLPYPAVEDFDLARFGAEGHFGFGQGHQIQLRIRITKASGHFLTESRLSTDQVVLESGDHLEISATVVQSAQLLWWLRGFGDEVHVLAPRSLACQLRSKPQK